MYPYYLGTGRYYQTAIRTATQHTKIRTMCHVAARSSYTPLIPPLPTAPQGSNKLATMPPVDGYGWHDLYSDLGSGSGDHIYGDDEDGYGNPYYDYDDMGSGSGDGPYDDRYQDYGTYDDSVTREYGRRMGVGVCELLKVDAVCLGEGYARCIACKAWLWSSGLQLW